MIARRCSRWTVLLVLLVCACATPIEYEDDWLDSPAVQDPSLTDPSYLVSTRPGLTAADRSRPVVIAVHGFTASTYEWREFREYAEANSDVLVSLVLLGGHGRSIDAFEKSSWEEWGAPILDEYRTLVAQGYTDVSFAGSSTGGALLLEQFASGVYRDRAPGELFLIDPIVVPGNKLLTLVRGVGPIIRNSPQENGTEKEKPYWYTNRPYQALVQLDELSRRVRDRLADGIELPEGTRAKVYKTSRDETADPVSAVYIYRGLRHADGGRIEVQMFDSALHVFTRLNGRDPSTVDAEDRARQRLVFEEMIARVSQ